MALSELPITLHGCNALVLGYGRIGRVLSKILDAFGAKVSVCARRYESLAWIHAMGLNEMNMCTLADNISGFDVIFNTVPSIILDKQLLRRVNKKALIIDLASKPGGVDFYLDKVFNRRKCYTAKSRRSIRFTLISVLSVYIL